MISRYLDEIVEKLESLQAELRVSSTVKLKGKIAWKGGDILGKIHDLEKHVKTFDFQTEYYFCQIKDIDVTKLLPKNLAMIHEQSRRICHFLNMANPSMSVTASLARSLMIEGLQADDSDKVGF